MSRRGQDLFGAPWSQRRRFLPVSVTFRPESLSVRSEGHRPVYVELDSPNEIYRIVAVGKYPPEVAAYVFVVQNLYIPYPSEAEKR
jgi:hypothetical protein